MTYDDIVEEDARRVDASLTQVPPKGRVEVLKVEPPLERMFFREVGFSHAVKIVGKIAEIGLCGEYELFPHLPFGGGQGCYIAVWRKGARKKG